MSLLRPRPLLRVLIALLAIAGLGACAGTETAAPPPSPSIVRASPPSPLAAPVGEPQAEAGQPSAGGSLRVQFHRDAADITGSAMQILWTHAPDLRAGRLALLRIEGFTDAGGSAAYNRALSRRRAEAVADQLRKLGLTAERIEIVGHGIDRAGRASGAARADLRRVEVHWTPAPGPQPARAATFTPPVASDVGGDLRQTPAVFLGAFVGGTDHRVAVASIQEQRIHPGLHAVLPGGHRHQGVTVHVTHHRLPSVRAGPIPAVTTDNDARSWPALG